MQKKEKSSSWFSACFFSFFLFNISLNSDFNIISGQESFCNVYLLEAPGSEMETLFLSIVLTLPYIKVLDRWIQVSWWCL